MSKKLEQAKADYLMKLKKVKLAEAGVDYNDLDVYVKYLKSDDEQEIKQQAEELAVDISAHNTARFGTYHDKRTLTLFNK